jgi:predicted deacetylase
LTNLRALCVSIHDVAPRTLHECRKIADAVAGIAPHVPLTLLVVPRYHGDDTLTEEFVQWVSERIERGDEVALHGYTHRDEAQAPRSLIGRMRRGIYTAGEGEFSALSSRDAAERIKRGCEWFSARGWQAEGFVAPAWLASRGTWEALRDFDFLYTTTLSHFHFLRRGVVMRAPSVVYSTRNAWRRHVSRAWNSALAATTRRMPLVRFGFHPADARHSEIMSHAGALLAELAHEREGLTKAAFARSVS